MSSSVNYIPNGCEFKIQFLMGIDEIKKMIDSSNVIDKLGLMLQIKCIVRFIREERVVFKYISDHDDSIKKADWKRNVFRHMTKADYANNSNDIVMGFILTKEWLDDANLNCSTCRLLIDRVINHILYTKGEEKVYLLIMRKLNILCKSYNVK